jgi:hypothetical protein
VKKVEGLIDNQIGANAAAYAHFALAMGHFENDHSTYKDVQTQLKKALLLMIE